MSEFENLVSEKNPVGRPAKGYENLHVQVPPAIKKKVEQLAEVFECSQGEIIHQAILAYIGKRKLT